MLIWLASYPRSGNTLLRILLNRCFGIETFSLYDDRSDIGADAELQRVVGHRFHGMEKEEFQKHALASSDTYFAKTHGMPTDDASAIYVVRDGRAAIVSYSHYLHDIGKKEIPLPRVIKGLTWAGSWSDHVNTWALSNRPKTLVLRFEDISAEPAKPMQQIADFLGLPAPREAEVDFDALRVAFPLFFRKGSNTANIKEFTDDDLTLFWDHHAETMRRMGYGSPPATLDRHRHATTDKGVHALARTEARKVSSKLKRTAAKESKIMLGHVTIGDRLEIYRVTGEGAGRSFSFLGGMNFVREKDDAPFMEALSTAEKKQVAEIRNRAQDEYHRKMKVDVDTALAALTGLAVSVQAKITPVSEEQDVLLTLAWQKLRQIIKVASGAPAAKAPATKSKL